MEKPCSGGHERRIACSGIFFCVELFYSLTSADLPANLVQAQRDYFGAHTFERKDELRGQFFHENWTGHGGDTKSGTYNV